MRLFLTKLYAVRDVHFDQFARVCGDPSLIEVLTGLDRCLLNVSLAERLERNDNPVICLAVEAILIEERAPQGQRCGLTIVRPKVGIACPQGTVV